MKRGQITIFIVVGIIILFVVAGLLFMRDYFEKGEIEVKEEKMIESVQFGGNVQTYIESCISQTAEAGVEFISKRGGYYNLPELSQDYLELPYYLYFNEDYSITKEEVELELQKYVDEMLSFCFEGFVYFEEKGYSIDEGAIKTEVHVFPTTLNVVVDLPILVSKENLENQIFLFQVDINSNLGSMLKVVKEFMQIQMEDPASFCVSCLYELNDEKFRIETAAPKQDRENEEEDVRDIIFAIIDKESLVEGLPFEFRFINKYGFEEWEE